MKMRIFSVALFCCAAVVALKVMADDKPLSSDVMCPVSGKAANKDHAVDYKGGKVYFCCDDCPAEFKQNKEKYSAKANHQMVQTGQLVQKACPLTGKKVNKSTETEIAGVKISFCCNNCKGQVAKAEGDDAKIALVFSDANMKKGFKKAKK